MSMTERFEFLCRTKTLSGNRSMEHLPFELSSMDAKKPFVLISSSDRERGCHKSLVRAFEGSGVSLGISTVTSLDSQSLKAQYALFNERGFDSIIAFGTGEVVDMAKLLNIVAFYGPEILRNPEKSLNGGLYPLVYIPTGAGCGMETCNEISFNEKTFSSPALMPDIALFAPEIMDTTSIQEIFGIRLQSDINDLDTNFLNINETSNSNIKKNSANPFINSGLSSLSICSEAYAMSNNPPARAYASVAISMVMESFASLIMEAKDILSSNKNIKSHKNCMLGKSGTNKTSIKKRHLKKSDTKAMHLISCYSNKKRLSENMTKIAQASAISGYIRANIKDIKCIEIANLFTDSHPDAMKNIPAGQCMAMLLPEILITYEEKQNLLGSLLLPLSDQLTYAATPLPQRRDMALHSIRTLLNDLFIITDGRVPRTIDDTGIPRDNLSTLMEQAGRQS
ncbi:hypothetical protein MTBBW1_120004 [Desulfamplus magnetovallimortis]|uniref:Alcohol dehydrogenase iron-type/glycerol dehydrogenase GldA domain-containing protein n=1 Tax=Desulfamplus magnetovallimortis TaxID=1246637 RepID=A0A1W1H5X9_9BACT|nr:iron-containing alcohol dehydrogenase [Desulfamplus magnetovallimortis]SLM27883.1 hypothetical protein MTBBW1_120004 [Desulfamplus magnetovallimortis]